MRVLVLTASAEFTAGVRLLGALAASLAERGDVVAVVCTRDSVVARTIGERWPRLSVRAVVGSGRVGQFAQVRGLVSTLRPDAMLVGSATDTQLAAWAMGARGGVVRRLTMEERLAPVRSPWRRSRTRVDSWGADALAIGWTPPTPPVSDSGVAVLPRITEAPPELLVLAGDGHDDAVATALRAAAALRARHATLRVTLVGDRGVPQETRVHAASLGLTPALEVIGVDALLSYARPAATVLWSAASTDAGALGVLAAMQQQVPVVVAADAPSARLVAPAITGFHWRADTASTVVAEVARLLGDADARRAMGDAAATRVAREFSWDRFVTDATERLIRVAGGRTSSDTRRPTSIPA